MSDTNSVDEYMSDYDATHTPKNYIIVRAKTGNTEYRIDDQMLSNLESNFFSGLYDFINSTKKDNSDLDTDSKNEVTDSKNEVIELDESQEFLEIIIRYLKFRDFNTFYSISIDRINDLLERTRYYCLSSLENLVYRAKNNKLYRIEDYIELPVHSYLEFNDFNEQNICSRNNYYNMRRRTNQNIDNNIHIVMNIKEQVTRSLVIMEEDQNRSNIEIFLVCEGKFLDDNIYTFRTLNIEVRNKHNRLIFTQKNHTFWKSNDTIKIASINSNHFENGREILKVKILYENKSFS